MIEILFAFNVFILVYFAVLNGTYLILSLTAFRSLRRYIDRLESLQIDDLLQSSGGLPISLVVPAFNESETIVASVRSLLTLQYADYEIVVVNDGSTDQTLDVLLDAFDLEPIVRVPTSDLPSALVHAIYQGVRHQNLVVVDKANGGKADALNVGLNYSRSALFCAMDADTILEPDALARVVRPFLEDASTVAVGGIVRIANGCTIDGGSVDDVKLPDSILVRFQVLEYLRVLPFGARGLEHDRRDAHHLGRVRGLPTFRGRRRRWFRHRHRRRGHGTDRAAPSALPRSRTTRTGSSSYQIPVAWTEAPESCRVSSGRQRDRWQRGLAQVIWSSSPDGPESEVRCSRACCASRTTSCSSCLGPVIELLVTPRSSLPSSPAKPRSCTRWRSSSIAVFLGSAISISAVALEEISFRRYRRFSDLLALLGVALAESFGYRQMSIWWRLRGLVAAARSDLQWGAMERRGLGRSAGQVDDPTNRDEAATEREVPARAADAEVEIIVTDQDVAAEQTVPK